MNKNKRREGLLPCWFSKVNKLKGVTGSRVVGGGGESTWRALDGMRCGRLRVGNHLKKGMVRSRGRVE